MYHPMHTCIGSVILLEACGDDCVSLCHHLLGELVSTDEAYVSPTPSQGACDSQALKAVIETSLTM